MSMISWDRVAELRRDLGEEDFHEIVALFLEEVDEIVATLGEHSDAAAQSQALHALKGSSVNLGFVEMSRLCHTLERETGADGAAPVDVDPVIDSFRVSRTAFLAGLAEDGDGSA